VQRPLLQTQLFFDLSSQRFFPTKFQAKRRPKKHQLEPDMRDLSQTLEFSNYFALGKYFFLGK
jgi:hypothetical protein